MTEPYQQTRQCHFEVDNQVSPIRKTDDVGVIRNNLTTVRNTFIKLQKGVKKIELNDYIEKSKYMCMPKCEECE